jgi:hypothetical protein
MGDSTAATVTNSDDLVSACALKDLRIIHFQITNLAHQDFVRFVALFAIKFDKFQHVTHVVLDAAVHWTRTAARDFMNQLSMLPNFKSFTWVSTTNNNNNPNNNASGHDYDDHIPIPLLTLFCNRCERLESLVLDGLSFLTTRVEEQVLEDESTVRSSATMEYFSLSLKVHPQLKLFRCVHCTIKENSLTQTISAKSLLNLWVDEMLKSLAYVRTLECMEIRVAPNHDAAGTGRVLLGLCKDGELANAAVTRLTRQILQAHVPPGARAPYQKLRLWIADGYEPLDGPQLLFDICQSLHNNTFLNQFRVRGSPEAASRFVTPAVITAYKELLDAGGNYALTSCDLMAHQGKQVDFLCRLNSLGRASLMEDLHYMDQEDWVEDVLLRFVDDLDALFYWNGLHPLLLTWHLDGGESEDASRRRQRPTGQHQGP